jgi:hypothetical protein
MWLKCTDDVARLVTSDWVAHALFAWLISHQPAVLFSQNKPAISNQPAVLFSQNKPAPAISHQPTEQAINPPLFCFRLVASSISHIEVAILSVCPI